MENLKSIWLFNMGNGKARSFVDLMNAVGSALGRVVKINFVNMPKDVDLNYQYFTEFNSKKLTS